MLPQAEREEAKQKRDNVSRFSGHVQDAIWLP
jgi:hypothetical protein